jgi:tryptophan-rich sensory protein
LYFVSCVYLRGCNDMVYMYVCACVCVCAYMCMFARPRRVRVCSVCIVCVCVWCVCCVCVRDFTCWYNRKAESSVLGQGDEYTVCLCVCVW